MTVDETKNALETDSPPIIEPETLPRPQTTAYRKTRRNFLCAIVMQLGILAVMYALPAHTLAVGERVYLKVRPADPWDMFRGQYMELRYDASQVPGTGLHFGQTVYVTLRKELPYAIPERAYAHMPEVDRSKYVVIRGTVSMEATDNVSVKYGIERFYFQEKTGNVLENNASKLRAELAVDGSGACVLKRVTPI
jgi:uncharacterized membrane-anchored protein